MSTMTGKQLLELRRKLNMNQTVFWARVGKTQSAGSRYESGRSVDTSLQLLLALAYGNKPLAALAKLRGCKVDELK